MGNHNIIIINIGHLNSNSINSNNNNNNNIKHKTIIKIDSHNNNDINKIIITISNSNIIQIINEEDSSNNIINIKIKCNIKIMRLKKMDNIIKIISTEHRNQ